MNNSQRIRVSLDETVDKHVKVKLDQSADFFEILSLKIDQKDIYQSFNADYGVLVGRVLANGSVGIPNAKISIFIPIEEDDLENPEIYAAYPYEKPYDKNRSGKRYNLLPRVGKEDPITGAIKPKQPFGSFPTKEEFVTNETWLEVYDKYYKYSTVSNNAGDYMIFGVPVGIQTVHMSVDITDIGKYSMSPIDMVTQLGYSENLFTSTGEIRPQNDLEDLPHIETQEISVDVVPFWGDSDNFEIGITRQDFRIRAQLVSNFVVFGSYFTQGRLAVNGDPDRSVAGGNGNDDGFYRLSNDYFNNVDIRTNRVGDLSIKLYSYNQNINMSIVDNDITTSGTTIDPQTDIYFVDPQSYFSFIDNENGQFIMSVPCNRRKVITDEFGNETVVSDDNTDGVFTEFYGMAFFEHEDLSIEKTYSTDWRKPNSPNNARLKLKIPQDFDSIRDEVNPQAGDYAPPWAKTVAEQIKESERWRKKYFTFKGGEFYSISQFFGTKLGNNRNTPDYSTDSLVNTLAKPVNMGDWEINKLIGAFKVGGEVRTTQEDLDNVNVISGASSGGTVTGTSFLYDFPYNATIISPTESIEGDFYFGGQWMNMSMYFPQINWTFDYMTAGANQRNQNIADVFWKDYYKGFRGKNGEWFSVGNSKFQNVVGGEINTSFSLSAHALKTNFIKVSKEDAVLFASITRKGLNKNDEFLSGETLTGEYMYTTPNFPTTIPADPWAYQTNAYDENYNGSDNPYFFKGMYNADAIQLLFDLNFI